MGFVMSMCGLGIRGFGKVEASESKSRSYRDVGFGLLLVLGGIRGTP